MPPASNRPHIRIVQSRQNSRVKELRAGFARGNRTDNPLISIEGLHLIEEALRARLRIATLFLRSGSEQILDQINLPADPSMPALEILELPPDLFASAVDTESPQGIAALIAVPSFTIENLIPADYSAAHSAPLLVVAASLQDPGNLGTLIRSAEAFGATGLIVLPGTVSHWNAKALRASSGSAFRLPIVAASETAALALLRTYGIQVLAATVDGGTPARDIDLTTPTAILIGNEGAGLSASLIAAADRRITIPCPGPVESLNAAIAASILLYEAAGQRSAAHSTLKTRQPPPADTHRRRPE